MKEQLIDIIYNSKTNKHKYNVLQYPDVYEWVLKSTVHLPDTSSFLERIYCVLNDDTPICQYGNQKKFTQNLKSGYMFCGRETSCRCAYNNKSKKISESKQNMSKEEKEKSKIKRKETCLSKYGVEFNSQNKKVKEKKKNTFQKKYGVEVNLQLPAVKEQIRKTKLKKYGNETYNNREKARATYLLTHGIPSNKYIHYTNEDFELLSNNILFQKKLDSIGIQGLLEKYNISESTLYKHIRNNPEIKYEYKTTNIEYKIKKILNDLGIKYDFNNRSIISPYELDFYIPDYNIAIEVCGLFWHSENAGGKDKNYHLVKHILCQKKDIRLITIFEDELYNETIVNNRLKHIFLQRTEKIYPRSCDIREISIKDARDFCNEYHIQGYSNSKIKIGAYYNDDLVAVMTFGKARRITNNKSIEYELIRFCMANYSMPGMSSKLFKYFVRKYNPSEVITYSDSRWSNGDVYEKMGFTFKHFSPPNYYYTKDYKTREHRFNYRKGKLVGDGYSKDKTEKQIMEDRGYDRIWDCGNGVWVWYNNHI